METTDVSDRPAKRAKPSCDEEATGGGLTILAKSPKKGLRFQDMPPEILLIIWEAAMDLPPSVIYVGAQIEKIPREQRRHPTSPDRCIQLQRPTTNQFNRWHWAQRMAREFFHASRAVEKVFGTRETCLADPLRSARPDKDLVLYLFNENRYQNYSWSWRMHKNYNRSVMGRGIENVGILWDAKKANAFWCFDAHHKFDGVKICPSELAHFLDHFADVKNVFIQLFLRTGNTKARSMAGIKQQMKRLTEKQRTQPELARFEDTDRIWIEVDEETGRTLLNSTGSVIFDVLATTRTHLVERTAVRPLEDREKIRFRVLVASWLKNAVYMP